MRALVTGASGFVGHYLIHHLHDLGYEVWASSRRPLKKYPFPIRWLKANLSHSEETQLLIRKSSPDLVFHLAAQTSLNHAWEDPEETFKINSFGTIFLLESILRLKPRARVLVVSTVQVYGTTFYKKRKVQEEDIADPVSPYAGSKRLAELATLDFSSRHGLNVMIARTSNQVGAGQDKNTAFPQFCRQIARMEKGLILPILKVGNLEVTRDFVPVQDAVSAYGLIMKRGKRGEIYNVGSGCGINLKKVVQFLRRESQIPFRVQIIPSLFRKNDIPYAVIDPSKLKRLGWQPKVSVWDGLREVLDEWRQQTDTH